MQVLVLREQFLDGLVGDGDVLRITGERHPAERAKALAEQRTDVGRDEAGEFERPVVAALAGLIADGVAVVEDLGAGVLEFHHRLDVAGHGGLGLLGEPFRISLGLGVPFGHRDALGQVGQRIVGGGLVGDDVKVSSPAWWRRRSLREHLGGVAHVPDGPAAALVLGGQDLGDGGVEIGFDLVQVALAGPAAQPGLVDVDNQAGAVVQGDGQRLGAAHAAAAAGQGQGAGERALGGPSAAAPVTLAAASCPTAANVSYVPCRMPCVPM